MANDKSPTAPKLDDVKADVSLSTSTAGEKVTVACKLPHGLILRCYDMVDGMEPVQGNGFKTIKVAQQINVAGLEEVRINGNAIPYGKMPDFALEGGYALTEGVPREFWDRWVKDNAKLPAIVNKLVWATPKAIGYARDAAKEMAEIKSGLEPINPDAPGRGVEKFNPKAA